MHRNKLEEEGDEEWKKIKIDGKTCLLDLDILCYGL